MTTADLTTEPATGDALRDAHAQTLRLAEYLQRAVDERPREDVDAAVAKVRAELEPQIQRQAALIVELRRQMRPLVRQSDAWRALLRLCQDADQAHLDQQGIGSGYATVPTDTVRAVLDRTPHPPHAENGGDR